jgi:hypothetical protein
LHYHPTSSLDFPVLPEPVTEGDTLEEGLANVPDELAAVQETYSEQGRTWWSEN